MQKIREALRLHSEADMAVRQICVSVGASVGTVQSWLSKTRQAHLGWPLALQMSDEELAVLIYGDEGRGISPARLAVDSSGAEDQGRDAPAAL